MNRFYHLTLRPLLLSLLLASCSSVVPAQTTNMPVEVESPQEPTPAQTAAPLPTSETVGGTQPDSLDIPYTEANPLTDPDEILRILDRLQEHELAWFSHEGWLHYTIDTADASDFTRIQHFWIHVTDKNLGCAEQFVYFESEGEILPYTIRLENGSAVRINPLDGQLSTEFVYETTPICTLKNNWIITFSEGEDDYDFILHDEAVQFRTFINQDILGIEKHVRAWKEDVDGKQTLVLEYEKNYTDPSLAGLIYDTHAGTFNLPARELQRIFIDLESGLLVRKQGTFFDKNGQQLNTWRSATNIGVLYFYEFYEELPQPVAQVYDQAAEKLRTILQDKQQ